MIQELSKSQRSGILLTLMIGTLMGSLDASIVNISLPNISRSLDASVSGVDWVVSAYLLGFAVVMPLTHWLKDRIGYFHLYAGSLLIFTFGSLLCGIAPTLPFLISARVIQAVGGGALTPTAMAILALLYEPKERGQVLGIWGLGIVLGPALGPTLGGVLTETFGWPSIFLINIPIGILGLYLSVRTLKPIVFPETVRSNFDLLGFTSLSVFLIALLIGISRIDHTGFASPMLFTLALACAVALWIFVRIEKRRKYPLVDLSLFKIGPYMACLAVTFLRASALFGGVFLLPFLLQTVLKYSETESGLLMFPGAGLIAVFMPFAGKWADKKGPKGIIVLGLVLVAISMFTLARMGIETGPYAVLWAMVLRGAGLGLIVTPITVATVNCVPEEKVALASSLSSLAQQVGGAIGVAGLAVAHGIFHRYYLQTGLDERAAEAATLQQCFTISGILMLASLIPVYFIPSLNSATTSSVVISEH